jgi:hypothetical protein
VRDQANGQLKYDGNDKAALDRLLGANEVKETGASLKVEIGQVIKLEDIKKESARMAGVVDAFDSTDVLSGIKRVTAENKEKKDRATKPFDDKLVEKNDKRKLRTRLSGARAKEARVVIDDLLDNGKDSTKELIEDVRSGGGRGKLN